MRAASALANNATSRSCERDGESGDIGLGFLDALWQLFRDWITWFAKELKEYPHAERWIIENNVREDTSEDRAQKWGDGDSRDTYTASRNMQKSGEQCQQDWVAKPAKKHCLVERL